MIEDYYLEIDINALRKTYAAKVIKEQEKAFTELREKFNKIADEIIEQIKEDLGICGVTGHLIIKEPNAQTQTGRSDGANVPSTDPKKPF